MTSQRSSVAQRLPLEIIREIARFAWLAEKPRAFFPLYGPQSLMARASLVCKGWRHACQAQLCAELGFHSFEQVHAFLESELANRHPVHLLRISPLNCRSDETEEVLGTLLRRANSVKHLIFVNALRGLYIDQAVASNLKDLVTLELDYHSSFSVQTGSTDPSDRLVLPSVKNLLIGGDCSVSTLVALADRISFPVLQLLDVRPSMMDHRTRDWFGNLLEVSGAHLTEMRFILLGPNERFLDLMDVLRAQNDCYPSLDTIKLTLFFMHHPCTVDAEGAFENMLATIPSTTPVRKLELKLHFYDEGDFFAWEDGITDWVMRGVLPHLKILNMVVIATAQAMGDDSRLMGPRWNMLRHACQRRGIALGLTGIFDDEIDF